MAFGEEIESLRDLGLSSYEDRAYRALLSIGSGTAKEVAGESDIPMGRVYDALNGLVSQGIAREGAASEPKRYAPVEPATAVDRLIDARRRELESQLETYEANRASLVDRLGSLNGEGGRFWTATVGPEETAELLWERFESAEDRIVMVSTSLPPHLEREEVGPRTLELLFDALRRDVQVSILLSPDVFEEMIDAVDADQATLALEQTGLELRLSEEPSGDFHLIDDREVCMELPDPMSPDRLFAMVNVRDRTFAHRVAEEFDAVWARAEPVDSL